MQRLFGIDRSRRETETVCVERNYTYVEQSAISRSYVLTLVFYGPRTPTELLAVHLAAEAQTQDSIDECALKNPEPTATDSSQKCKRNEGEDERDGKISEKNAENGRRADETAKELRASLPRTTSSHANPPRSDYKRQEWLMLSTLSIRWCHVCSAQSMICRVISE